VMDIPRRAHHRDSGAWVEAMQMESHQKQEGHGRGELHLLGVIAGTGAVSACFRTERHQGEP
jgi:hypothetical protein